MNIDMEFIGRRIKLIRKSLGLKQIELAESLEITQSYLSYVELGKNKPSFGIIAYLYYHHGIYINHILDEKLSDTDLIKYIKEHKLSTESSDAEKDKLKRELKICQELVQKLLQGK